jgi:chromosome segregation ATPase
MKRTLGYDQQLQSLGQQGPASVGSGFGPTSPLSSQHPNRTLPSPPSAQYQSPGFAGPSQFSPAAVSAAHASHLQDLQHQISTKTLALQTLQREHDQLLAAFSRSQIRCSTLDKKSQVSDHEINTLTEEKIRLQQQVENLESSVEELVKSRDEVHKQSSADGAQWRQIMAMSSQLQMKGAEEARRYKADRDAWDEDRAALQRQIEELESRPSKSEGKRRSGSNPGSEDESIEGGSMEAMREQIIKLRQKCASLELMLQELSGGTDEIDNAINAMTLIRQRIAGKKKEDDES